MAGELRAQPVARVGEEPGEQRMVLGEAGAGGERLLPHRRHELLGERHERGPRLRVVRARADDERRALGVLEQRDELLDRGGVGLRRVPQPLGRGDLQVVVGDRDPVVHRHDHERRPAVRAGCVVGAGDGARHVLGADRLLHGHGVLAGEALEPPGEERLRREVAAVLLPDDDDERRAVHACRRERRDRVAQPGRRVQDRERGLVRRERETGRQSDDRGLVERQHEAQVLGQPGEQLDLRRSRVGEDGGEAALAQDVERRVADRGGGDGCHGAMRPSSAGR